MGRDILNHIMMETYSTVQASTTYNPLAEPYKESEHMSQTKLPIAENLFSLCSCKDALWMTFVTMSTGQMSL